MAKVVVGTKWPAGMPALPGKQPETRSFRNYRNVRNIPKIPRIPKMAGSHGECFLAGSFSMRVDGTGIDTRPSQLASKGTMEHGLKQIAQAAATGGLLVFWSPAEARDNSPRRKPWEQGFSNKAKAPDGAAGGDRLGSRAFLVKTHTPTASGNDRPPGLCSCF